MLNQAEATGDGNVTEKTKLGHCRAEKTPPSRARYDSASRPRGLPGGLRLLAPRRIFAFLSVAVVMACLFPGLSAQAQSPLALGQLSSDYAFDTGRGVSVPLPLATGGTPPYTYSLSRSDGASLSSDGLSFNANTRVLTGNPPASSEWGGTQTCSNITCVARSIIYTVTDDAGNTAQRTGEYHLLEIPSGFLPTPDDLNFTRDTAITSSVTLPKTVDDQFTYRVSQLPPGLSFDAATRELTGTPTETGTTEVTYTASGGHWFPTVLRAVTFDITVHRPPALSTPRNRAFTAHRPATVTLPAATGGSPPHTYTLRISPNRPLRNGLSFDPSTRVLSVDVPDSGVWSGTSSDCGDGVICQNLRLDYKVTDAAGATVTRDFEGGIFDYPPGFLPAQDDLSFTPGTAISPVTLRQTADKAQIYTYALTGPGDVDVSDAVPGLSFDPSSRVLSGAPTTEGVTTVTYTATHGGAAFTPTLVHTVTFGITVAELALPAQDGVAYSVDTTIAPLTLPEATGGTTPHTYALTGPNGVDLSEVPGLTFDSATRVLSGKPTEQGETTLTYTVTDSATTPESVTRTFAVTVTRPIFIAEVADRTYEAGASIAPLILPEATGGTAPYTYALTGPNGTDLSEAVPRLSFDPATRVLSGTPDEEGETTLTYTVTDSATTPESVTRTFAVTVTVTGPISIAEVDNQTYEAGEDASLTLPAATGGTAPYTYALTGPNGTDLDEAVPGLTFDSAPDKRELSGTPRRAGATTLTYTVTDSAATPASVTRTFTVTVTVTGPISIAEVDNQTYEAGASIDSLTLPAATGGTAPYTYALTGPNGTDLDEAVPGLTFKPDARELSGIPTRAGTTTLTYTATDSEGNSTSTTFDVTVTVTGPVFDAAAVAEVEEIAGDSYPAGELLSLTLPEALGVGVTYALTGPNGTDLDEAVPGLTFKPDARELSGTPTRAGTTTLTYTATDSEGNSTSITFAVTVTSVIPAALNEVLLPEVARAMAGSTVGAIARRIGQAARGAEASGLSVGGQDGWAALRAHGEAVGEGHRGFEELLSGSGFVLPLNAAAGGAAGASSVALWGSGEYRDLSGKSGTLDWDGELVGVHLGVDARPREDLLAGVAVSWLSSDLDYEDATGVAGGGFGGGIHSVELTSVHPYLGWRAGEGLDVWATAGYGEGELEVTPAGRDRRTSDLDMRTVGAGGSGVLLERGVSTVRLKGEVMHSTLEVDDSVHIEGVEVEAMRVRMTVEAGQTHTLADGGVLEPSLEVGVRHDGGDGETGNGAELGGSVSYRHPSGRITAEGRVYALVAGHDGDHEEWGIEGHLGVSPGAGGRGLSLSVRPGYGDSGEGGIGRLWRQEVSEVGDSRTGGRRSASGDPSRLWPVPARLHRSVHAVHRDDGGRGRGVSHRRELEGGLALRPRPGGRAPRVRRRSGRARPFVQRRGALLAPAGGRLRGGPESVRAEPPIATVAGPDPRCTLHPEGVHDHGDLDHPDERRAGARERSRGAARGPGGDLRGVLGQRLLRPGRDRPRAAQ